MKKTILLILFLFTGIVTAIGFGFHHLFPFKELPYDDDQKGLRDQVLIKFSHVVAENTPKGLAVDRFARLVEEKSDGRIKVAVFPNGSLYSDIEEVSALEEGTVQMIAPATSKLQMLSPKWGVLDLPFIFPNEEAVRNGLEGSIGKELLQTFDGTDIKGLALWSNGFKQLTTNEKVIKKPKDVSGQKFRIMQSPVLDAQFTMLRADGIQHQFNDTYSLLDRKEIDGEENTVSNIYSKGFYNVQQNMTITNHGYLAYAVMINRSFWDEQDEETKNIILEAMKEATAWNENEALEKNKEQLQYIRENSSMKIHTLTKKERKEWLNALSPLYKKYEEEFGPSLMKEAIKLRDGNF
ncbi:DctP family TRAP transporter solute-binding subunit [Priestia filamentosa]|uniref:DctP family TRAP transporter solute-binding subunit n=1 Tax=Priestia filamentosa TaxID=1402861 RepID=UPI0023490171|nr:DctP family TRAP transporter solute-binding subunit [Priestia filamentosa]WCM14611.1 DctP family TRAP transporter solute-binding subunit [Priestia filamentosa]